MQPINQLLDGGNVANAGYRVTCAPYVAPPTWSVTIGSIDFSGLIGLNWIN
jgi:hypothetical protein